MTLASGGSLRLIRETLDSVVAPAVRDALISTALEEFGVAEVPTDADKFRAFVAGPLRTALLQGLGDELADSIVEELHRMAQLTEHPPSTVKARSRPHEEGTLPTLSTPRPLPDSSRREPAPAAVPPASEVDPNGKTMPPPSPVRRPPPRDLTPPPFSATPASSTQSRPGSEWDSAEYPAGVAGTIGFAGAGPDSSVTPGRPHVLVASSDTTLVRRLTPWLDATAELAVVSSIRELVKDLEALGDGRVVVLVDCRRPSIRPTAIAALADELPSNIHVVLWGASPEQERGVLAVSPAVSRWVVLQSETRPKELAARCADLVG